MPLKTKYGGVWETVQDIDFQIHLNRKMRTGISGIATLVSQDHLVLCAIDDGKAEEFEPEQIPPTQPVVENKLVELFGTSQKYEYCDIWRGERRIGIVVYSGTDNDYNRAIYFLVYGYNQKLEGEDDGDYEYS